MANHEETIWRTDNIVPPHVLETDEVMKLHAFSKELCRSPRHNIIWLNTQKQSERLQMVERPTLSVCWMNSLRSMPPASFGTTGQPYSFFEVIMERHNEVTLAPSSWIPATIRPS